MQIKKIIFAVTNDLNNDQRMHKICGSLQAAGYKVLLVGRSKRSSKPLSAKSFNQIRLSCFFEKGKLFYIEYNIRLFFKLIFTPADIVCTIDLDTIVPCAIAGKWKGCKLVYDAHEYFTEVPEVMHRPAIQKTWRWVEQRFVPRMDACYTVSQSLADLFHEKYRIPFSLIINAPILVKDPEPITIPDQRYMLYQGALNMGRGLEMLIEAIKQVPIRLYIAGEGDLSEALRQQVKNSGLTDKVIFLGMISPEELKKITAAAFLGYNLLENLGLSYYFSLSNKFFDYIHACIPGISNHFPEYERINSAYEVAILTNLSVSEIVLSIERALKDKTYYESLVENCKIAKQVFNWQAEEKKLIQIYNAL